MFPDIFLDRCELYKTKDQYNKHGDIFGLKFCYRKPHVPENEYDMARYDYIDYIMDFDNPDRDLVVLHDRYSSRRIFREDYER